MMSVATPEASTVKLVTHPSVAQMVVAAIKALEDPQGSSLAAIKKYIAANYRGADPVKLAPFIRRFLKKAVADGKLKQIKDSFMINDIKAGAEEAKSIKTAAKIATTAKSPKMAKKPDTAEKVASEKQMNPEEVDTPKKVETPIKVLPKKAHVGLRVVKAYRWVAAASTTKKRIRKIQEK